MDEEGLKEGTVERKTSNRIATWISIPADQLKAANSSSSIISIYPTANHSALEMERLKKIWSIISSHDSVPLDMMDLGPATNTENPVMVSFLYDRVLG